MGSKKNNSISNEYLLLGNEYYRSSNFFCALELYNKSLCHAIPLTEEFAIGFANRSAVYFETAEFEKCMENIQMAISLGYPRHKMKKLLDRYHKCQELIYCCEKNPNENPWNFFKLSYPSYQKIPYIIECVELRDTKKFGRHLITTRKLIAGDIIAIEEPFYKYIMNTSRFTHCTNCLKSEKLNLIPCLKCNYTMFCSTKCMSIGHRFHQFECDVEMNLSQDNCIFQMCHRTVFEALGIFGDVEKLRKFFDENSSPKNIFNIGDISIMKNKEKERNILLSVNSLQKNKLRSELLKPMEDHCKTMMLISDNQADKKFINDFMRNQMSLIITNSFGLTKDHEEFGAGVFPFASYFNHSCAPNISRVTLDGRLIFVTIRPIEKNQQLFICYRENFFYKETEARRNELFEAYRFTCKCEACRNNYATLDELPKYDTKLKISSSNIVPIHLYIEEYKRNCDYINVNYRKYPSYETCKLIERNYNLLNYIVSMTSYFPLIEFEDDRPV